MYFKSTVFYLRKKFKTKASLSVFKDRDKNKIF